MLVFVYGTLKTHCCNHHVLQNLIGEKQKPVPVKSVKKYPMYKSEYYFPYLENQPGIGENIVGQIVEVDDDLLYKLDHFEGVPDLYKRGTIKVKTGNIEMDCLCYFKAQETNLKNKSFLTEWVE